ncbi:MAG: Ppx/GppA phosphatase family protein [Rhodovibrio sp.]|nr:Ppx/GppA phosphatase family protein [Rhodovibrio sp.]
MARAPRQRQQGMPAGPADSARAKGGAPGAARASDGPSASELQGTAVGSDPAGVGRAATCYAAIDLGTNNCRLLVARPAADGFKVVDAFSRIVRLGEGVTRSRTLSEAAMARAIDALGVCAAKVRRRPGCRLRAVATAACRQALNRNAFLERVRRETGLELEVIDPQEEARLALGGCAPLLDARVPNGLIFDIGGGSTELCWLTLPAGGDAAADGPGAAQPELVAWHSMPVGVANLAERFAGAPDTPETYEAMVARTADALSAFAGDGEVTRAFAGRPVQMVGASGTVTTLAGVAKDLPRYDRRQVDGTELSAETVRATSRRIAAMTPAERQQHPCIGPQRADLVIAGCAILEAICQAWPVERLTVADRGLREGILYHLMQERGEPVASMPPL